MPTQVLPIVKKEYDFEEAVIKAAEQNIRRDHRIGECQADSLEKADSEMREVYLSEARCVLEQSGENYLPEHPDNEHICVKK